jgi:hypothetical protein
VAGEDSYRGFDITVQRRGVQWEGYAILDVPAADGTSSERFAFFVEDPVRAVVEKLLRQRIDSWALAREAPGAPSV